MSIDIQIKKAAIDGCLLCLDAQTGCCSEGCENCCCDARYELHDPLEGFLLRHDKPPFLLIARLETSATYVAAVLGEYLGGCLAALTVLDGDCLNGSGITQSDCLAVQAALCVRSCTVCGVADLCAIRAADTYLRTLVEWSLTTDYRSLYACGLRALL